jgi:hypothetical protein
MRGIFADENGEYSSHYRLPENAAMLIKQLASLMLRLLENGRIVIWLSAVCIVYTVVKNKIKLSGEEKMLGLFFVLITGLYFLFAFITSMPFSARYFMIHFFVLSLLVFRLAVNLNPADKKLKTTFTVMLFFIVTGHCWIYPEKYRNVGKARCFTLLIMS